MTELLSTKTRPPRLPAGLVPRGALVERLRAGLSGRLTLLSAPAGYGKTMLVASALEGTPRRAAWVTLDEGDNDPVQFWRYVVAAFVESGALPGPAGVDRLTAPGPRSAQAAVVGLVNALARHSDPCVLVLDEYQVIEVAAVHRGVERFLEHLPPHAHLVIASRVDPPLPLPRLRARGELAELRVADMRFTTDEAAVLLTETMGLPLTRGQVSALEERTEGWAAGLRLAGLSLERQQDAEPFVAAFGATHRYILDYLTEEVLKRQDEDLRAFMVHTAVLDRLCVPLCDAVTGRTDSNLMLPRVEAANLFILPLDDERRWYRYHRLFADLLRLRLREHDPSEASTLHERASRWFEQADEVEEAAHHALAAGDSLRAAMLIERCLVTLVTTGRTATVRMWLDALPVDALRSRPLVALWGSWACFLQGDVEEALRLVALAEPADQAGVPTLLLAMKAFLSRAVGDLALSLQQSREALARLSPEESLVRGLVTFNLAVLHTFGGDITIARRLGEEALALARGSQPFWDDAIIAAHLARVAIHSGRLREAEAICRGIMEEGLRLAGDAPLPALAHVYVSLGNVELEWDNLDEADDSYRRALSLGESAGELAAAFGALLGLCYSAFARGDIEAARTTLEEADVRMPSSLAPWVRPYLESWHARLAAADGDLTTALALAARAEEASDRHSTFAVAAFPCLLNVARVRLAAGHCRGLLDPLRDMAARAESEGRVGMLIEVLAVSAVASDAEGRPHESVACLERALGLAEGEAYARVFLNEGEPMARLLRSLAAQGRGGAYVGRLLAGLSGIGGPGAGGGRAGAARRRRAAGLGLPTPPSPLLSERELQILRLLAHGRSNREIAAELHLAEGTVKKHVYNICAKLGAARRSHAVARGRELGLL